LEILELRVQMRDQRLRRYKKIGG